MSEGGESVSRSSEVEPLLAADFSLSRVLPHLALELVTGKGRGESSSPVDENGAVEVAQLGFLLPRKVEKVPRCSFVEDGELAAAATDELMPRVWVYDQVLEGRVDLVRGDVVGSEEGSEMRQDVEGEARREMSRHVMVVAGVWTRFESDD